MNIQELSERQRSAIRKKCLRSLYAFCVGVMGYDDIVPDPHGAYCKFLESGCSRKQATMPRSFVKTWIGSIAYPIWITLPRTSPDEFPSGIDPQDKFYQLGPNLRILIASYVVSNAEKMIAFIQKAYESNVAMQILFPEVIPHNFRKVKWSTGSACINRTMDYPESTFEAAGIGGSSTSRHYDLIIEDDLIYAKKDDFTEMELQPSKDDIEKAIGWHKIASSLLVPGKHTRIHNTGTRWARHDLVEFIWTNEPSYSRFIRGAVDLSELELKGDWKECTPTWNKMYDHEQLQRIYDAQGPYMFATQYLLQPTSPQQHLFQKHWLQFYKESSEVPSEIRKFTTVDVAEWTRPTRKSDCSTVVLTCAWDSHNHVWVLHYDIGRFNPSQVIYLMSKHWKLFEPEKIGVETVYYQKALAHFAREYMNDGKVPWMSIIGLQPEGNMQKELRIRSLEPLGSNLAVHCKSSHKEFIDEWVNYIPNSKLCRKDILDTLAYQIQIARPGQVKSMSRRTQVENPLYKVSMDDFLKWAHDRTFIKNRFGNEGVLNDPYNTHNFSDLEEVGVEQFN